MARGRKIGSEKDTKHTVFDPIEGIQSTPRTRIQSTQMVFDLGCLYSIQPHHVSDPVDHVSDPYHV